MTLLVMTPLDEEFSFLTNALRALGHRSGATQIGPIRLETFEELNLSVAHGGHGKTQMAVQTRFLLDALPMVQWVVCVGAAGAISNELAVGDVVVADQTVEHDYTLKFVTRPLPSFPGDPGMLSRLETIPGISGSGIYFGIMASGDEDVIDVDRGARLAADTGAIAVAWEGAGAARASKLTAVPFVEIRGITDTANHTAPADFETNLEVAMINIAKLLSQFALSEPDLPKPQLATQN
jgi:adenosylhomocysteine nucleosidase